MKTCTIVFLTLVLFFSSCREDCEVVYSVEFPISISPAQDTSNVNDTIWYEMIIQDSIENVESNKLIDVSDTDFSFEVIISRFDTTHQTYVAQSNFEYVAGHGTSELNNWGLTIYLNKENNQNRFSIGIIPKEEGDYLIGTIAGSDSPYDIITKERECLASWKNPNEPFNFITNDGVHDNNLLALEGVFTIIDSDTLYYGTIDELKKAGTYILYIQ